MKKSIFACLLLLFVVSSCQIGSEPVVAPTSCTSQKAECSADSDCEKGFACQTVASKCQGAPSVPICQKKEEVPSTNCGATGSDALVQEKKAECSVDLDCDKGSTCQTIASKCLGSPSVKICL